MYLSERSASTRTSRWKTIHSVSNVHPAPNIFLSAFFVCLVWLLLGTRVLASTVLPMSVESMARASDCVVEATVQKVVSRWNSAGTQIYTDVEIDVTGVLGGNCALGSRVLHILGGRVGDLEMRVSQGPRFQAGERVVLFLLEDPTLFVPVVGLGRGKLAATRDAAVPGERIGNEFVGYFERQELIEAVTSARGGQ